MFGYAWPEHRFLSILLPPDNIPGVLACCPCMFCLLVITPHGLSRSVNRRGCVEAPHRRKATPSLLLRDRRVIRRAGQNFVLIWVETCVNDVCDCRLSLIGLLSSFQAPGSGTSGASRHKPMGSEPLRRVTISVVVIVQLLGESTYGWSFTFSDLTTWQRLQCWTYIHVDGCTQSLLQVSMCSREMRWLLQRRCQCPQQEQVTLGQQQQQPSILAVRLQWHSGAVTILKVPRHCCSRVSASIL
jgi:hypothetical protein